MAEVSLTGPWPGTTVSTSIARIRSHARTQFATGPAQMIGWAFANTMSPVNTVRSAGTCTSTSPRVCAGPTSIRCTSFAPTWRMLSPLNVSVGGVSVMPLNWNGPNARRTNSAATGPSASAFATSCASRSGGTSPISFAHASDATITAPRDQLVAEAVIAVRVGVHERVDPRRRRHRGAHRREHLGRERQVEERVDEQRGLAVDHEPGVAPSPGAVGLEPREAAGAEVVQSPRVRSRHAAHRLVRRCARSGGDRERVPVRG